MGGASCIVHRQATLKFDSVPTTVPEQALFDKQIRELYNWVAQDVVNDHPDKIKSICDTLGKPTWTQADRQMLFDTIESLYEP